MIVILPTSADQKSTKLLLNKTTLVKRFIPLVRVTPLFAQRWYCSP